MKFNFYFFFCDFYYAILLVDDNKFLSFVLSFGLVLPCLIHMKFTIKGNLF